MKRIERGLFSALWLLIALLTLPLLGCAQESAEIPEGEPSMGTAVDEETMGTDAMGTETMGTEMGEIPEGEPDPLTSDSL